MTSLKAFIIVLLFCCCNSYAQKFEIYTKSGEQILPVPGSAEISLENKRLYYKVMNDAGRHYVKYKDLDYAIINDHKLKYFDDKKLGILNVVAEGKERILATRAVRSESMANTYYQYAACVLDAKTYKVIDKFIFTLSDSKGKKRAELPAYVAKYFGDCKNVMDRLAEYPLDGDKNFTIAGFFTSAPAIVCD